MVKRTNRIRRVTGWNQFSRCTLFILNVQLHSFLKNANFSILVQLLCAMVKKKAEVIFRWPFVISITLMPISRKPELNSRHRCLCRRHRHIHCRFLFFLQQIWRVMHVRFIRSRPSRYLKYLQMVFVDSFYFFHSCSVIVSAMCKNCMMQYDDEFS